MEDVLIGRANAGERHDFLLDATTAQQILPRNNKRYALYFPGSQSNVVFVSPYGAKFDSTSNVGMLYFGGLLLTLKEHGDLVKAPWFALADAAAVVWWCAESLFYPDKFPEEPIWQNGNQAFQPVAQSSLAPNMTR